MITDSAAGVRPYISIVLTGRNDAYGGDFVARFLTTLQFNARELSARGIPHEFVLTEWAPPTAVPLLADLVELHCPPSVVTVFRSLIVDPAYHAATVLNPRLEYQEFLAKNVGVRRSRGEYLITSNCDVFLGRHILQRLQRRELEPGVVYRASRWDIQPVTSGAVDWAYLDDPVNLVRPPKVLEPPFFRGAAGDFIGLDRDTFLRVGGFNEVYRLARIGIDGNFLIHAISSGLTITDIGGPVYHLDHAGSYRSARPEYAGREHEAPYGDERWPADSVVYRNGPRWGLLGAPERQISPTRTLLEFSWDAVPPLVDLAGILAPRRLPGGVPWTDGVGGEPGDESPAIATAADAAAVQARALEALDGFNSEPLRGAVASTLDSYRRILRDLRALARRARRSIQGAPVVLADVQDFARRHRRNADKIATRRRGRPPA